MNWLFIPYMAWTSRMCGGAPPPLGRPYVQILFALPLALLCAKAGIFSVFAFAGAFFGKSTGHGLWMSLNYVIKKSHTEPLDFIVAWFWGQDPRVVATDNAQAILLSNEYGMTRLYWRSVTGLVVAGLAVTIIPAIIFGLFNSATGGVLLFLSGAGMAPAYMIGWKFFNGISGGIPYLNQPTEIGEFLTGLFVGVAIAFFWPF
jgi:hypothetical protein